MTRKYAYNIADMSAISLQSSAIMPPSIAYV
jgi:hypothetical protein